MSDSSFIVIYDTYCGWCYGAARVLEALVDSGAEVRVRHRYLFQGGNAHRMSDGFGTMAMKHDAQIGALTGQPFSSAYVDNILCSPTEVLESGLTAQAAALVHDQGARVELALAAMLQKARYVDGISASDHQPIVNALKAVGVDARDAEQIGTPGLEARARKIASLACQDMDNAGAGGVPCVVKMAGGVIQPVNVAEFYKDPARISAIAA